MKKRQVDPQEEKKRGRKKSMDKENSKSAMNKEDMKKGEKKSGKMKDDSDKVMPKRPKNAFMFFQLEKQKEVREKNPDIAQKDIFKVLGDQWKALSEAKKQPYYEMNEEDKKRYEDQLESYKKNGYFTDTDGVQRGMSNRPSIMKKKAKLSKSVDKDGKAKNHKIQPTKKRMQKKASDN